MAARRPVAQRNDYYVDGNTVRRVREFEEPQRRPAPRHRTRRRPSSIGRGYVIMLACAGLITLICCLGYLSAESAVQTKMNSIEALEVKLENQKAKNDELQTKINTSVDLSHIYQVATQELGMVYANPDQILLYDKTESEYVRQNNEIPKN